MLRRLLVVLGTMLAISGVLYAGIIALLSFSLMRSDPYPAFMARYDEQQDHHRTYDEARQIFGEFVAKTFPIGCDAEGAIAEITGGGFQVATSGADSVELVWKRSAGPCNEWYSIVLQKDAGGRVAKISGRLNPICL
jgi:hypothetical protein